MMSRIDAHAMAKNTFVENFSVQKCLTIIIRWMSQGMHKIAVNNDTFDAVYKNGIAPFERFVKENL